MQSRAAHEYDTRCTSAVDGRTWGAGPHHSPPVFTEEQEKNRKKTGCRKENLCGFDLNCHRTTEWERCLELLDGWRLHWSGSRSSLTTSKLIWLSTTHDRVVILRLKEMKQALLKLPLLVISIYLSACSTLEPVEMSAADLQSMILSGELPLEGESIKIVTSDGKSQQYRVTEVDAADRQIRGEKVSVSIDDVVAIETSEFSLGKTALLAGGSYVFLVLLAISAGPALIL